jgi:hypothetical protein
MKWQTAVALARSCADVTYEEWCDLYVDLSNPERQKEKASETAHAILVRNCTIDPSVVFVDL